MRTVSAILDAGAQVFVRVGYDRATTARIAERAGVSVGSFYQYFPSKDAVLVALSERHVGQSHATLDRALQTLETGAPVSLDEIVRTLVRALLDAHAASPRLHRLLSEHAPRIAQLGAKKEASDRELLVRAEALIARAPQARSSRVRAAVAMVARVLESLTHWYVIDAPDIGVDEPAFIEEVTALACGCLSSRPDGGVTR